ncbi:MAG: electron transfer flavoprotein subunit beta/FixA family protein [Novosphingobium sp.]|nr:electron transfer flavoprotein subunit beta/FixA family protein [Novosphingobium sp.]
MLEIVVQSRIVVLVKQVLDANVRPRVRPDGSGVDLAHLKLSMNPFDEIALEAAIRLKEQGAAQEVVALTVGRGKAQDTLRAALAMGADRSILVESEFELEPLAIAKTVRSVLADIEPVLVIAGKQAIDDDCHQTGQMLAALLGWGQALCASRIALSPDQVEVDCEVDNGRETLRLPLPAVVTTDLRLNTPRSISLPNLMKAKSKPLDIVASSTLGIDVRPRLKIVEVREPPVRSAGVRVHSAAEIAQVLKDLEAA